MCVHASRSRPRRVSGPTVLLSREWNGPGGLMIACPIHLGRRGVSVKEELSQSCPSWIERKVASVLTYRIGPYALHAIGAIKSPEPVRRWYECRRTVPYCQLRRRNIIVFFDPPVPKHHAVASRISSLFRLKTRHVISTAGPGCGAIRKRLGRHF